MNTNLFRKIIFSLDFFFGKTFIFLRLCQSISRIETSQKNKDLYVLIIAYIIAN